jgi:lipid II:glycine glycyltransferase (peptidoglycan interpeptide bridge formation enzyme)
MKELLCDTNRGRLLVSYLDEAPISASLFGIFNRMAYYVYGGASDFGKKSGGPGHVLWTAMTALKDDGIESLNLGGCRRPTGEADDSAGVYMFKKDFGGTEVVQPAGSKLISRLGSRLSRIRDRLKGVVGHGR